ncbi:uncharacterized protein LOC128220720 isoform X2 [Mya arenaria]|uniref:uncharacterized protein LOC128220720 isoform X2 n=1 Tax=Mya arenaria TaxID=6604 RepID=UPI0022E48FDE|nr:uncharacterized protein LOC128220720 isoform X2 [Mya arenaria]
MTNRTYVRPYSAGVEVKRPRPKRFDVIFDEAPPPTPEGIHNGLRPHGGYRGAKPLPPGQFSFNKNESYLQDIEDEYHILVNQENTEQHGAPYWVPGVQREITHSGESPLFTNKLFPTGKFEQEHGVVSYERALLSSGTGKRRLMSAPRRRHVNGKREFYRPNSTHQYLSATDLRNMNENEENMIKYGRPTRTTLLRARQQRTNSAPVNAYDIRRENNRRAEEVRNHSIFQTSKEYLNIYASDGETVHSFLTGARYNRARLLDSKGLTVYGVYMPRENPTDCFITGSRRFKDHGEEIPSAPPDSPRSETDETLSPSMSRSPSSRPVVIHSRPGTSNRPSTKQSSRPPSNRRSRGGSSRPISGSGTGSMRSQPRPPESPRRELPLPNEVTLEMPDHINKGKSGVYVTLKGQKMIESVDSKLPRVTGVSLPKINKPRDHMDEMMFANQPPPTPVDTSIAETEKHRPEKVASERSIDQNDENIKAVEKETAKQVADGGGRKEFNVNGDVSENEKKGDKQENVGEKGDNKENEKVISETIVVENKLTDNKSMEIGPIKKVNFSDLQTPEDLTQEITERKDIGDLPDDDEKVTEQVIENAKKDDNVVFFVTEGEKEEQEEMDDKETDIETVKVAATKDSENSGQVESRDQTESNDNNSTNETENTVEDVIKVEISETEKKELVANDGDDENDEQQPVTSEDYPFGDKK